MIQRYEDLTFSKGEVPLDFDTWPMLLRIMHWYCRSFQLTKTFESWLQMVKNFLGILQEEQEDDDNEDAEEENKAPPTKAQIINTAVLYLIAGAALAAFFADPLVDAIGGFSKASGISPFFIAFIATPLATNSSEAISSILFARRKHKKNISMTFSQVGCQVPKKQTFWLISTLVKKLDVELVNFWLSSCMHSDPQTFYSMFFLLHVSTSVWWLFCPDLCSYRFWFLTSVYSVVADLWCRYHEQHIVPWHLPCNRLLPGPHVGLLSWDNSDSLLHLSNGWVGSCAYDIPSLGGFHCHCSLPNLYWLGSLPWLCMWMALDWHNRFRWGEMYIFLQELLVFLLKHNSRPNLTSCWHPQLKLISRGLAGISAALHRVGTQDLLRPEVPE